MKNIYWSKITIEDWSMYSAATEEGLCYIGSPNASFEELERWVKKWVEPAKLIEDANVFQQYERELRQYYSGERRTFTAPLDLFGTDFQRKVWEVLQNIPYGKTCSYLEVAEKIQNSSAVRAVGGAIGANPILIMIPCHRVIAKDGKLGGFRAGLSMKERLLGIENS